MATAQPPVSGWGFVTFGVLLGAIGTGLLLALGSDPLTDAPSIVIRLLAIAFSAVGGILATIGSVAVGVTVGFRRADYRIRGN